MRASASPFFRDVTMPNAGYDRLSHERFLLDTLADRRASARPNWWARVRARFVRSK